jgi:hypothetical protein
MEIVSTFFPSRRTWSVSALAIGALLAICPAEASDPSASTGEMSSFQEPREVVVIDVELGGEAGVRTALDGLGARVVAFLGPRRWLVVGDSDVIASLTGIASAAAWRPTDAISADLTVLAVAAKRADRREVSVLAVLAPGAGLPVAARRLEAAGARVAWLDESAAPAPQLGLRVPAGRIDEVLDELRETGGLILAEPQAAVRLLNSGSVWRCQSGVPGSTPIFDHGLRGEGQIIGIMDTGLDIDDCRFDDPLAGLPALNRADGTEVNPAHRKVLAVDFHWESDWPPQPGSWDDHGHGTHVAGSAAGDELGNGTHDGVDGMAPAAKLVIQDGGALIDDCADLPGLGCPVKPLEPVLEQAWAQGARIHTNSWGDEENFLPYGRYTERTADVDRFMWNHRDTLVFFAAGNAGPHDDTLGSPATGKNVVAVGATIHGSFDPTCVAIFSSRGPTHDGRIKPDLLAPGLFTVSAATNRVVPGPSCDNAQSSGTSMAAPTAAGLGALVRQYFTDGFHLSGTARPADGFEPSAALVKATLIASGVDLSTLGCQVDPVPSRDQGWGLVQLDTALAFSGDAHRLVVDDHLTGFATPGDEPATTRVAVIEPGALKVVLAWTDAPSSSLAAVNLVNDLDLVVRGPGGIYRGNVFAAGRSIGGGLADRLNNVEVVWLPVAEKGVWTIEVAPHAIPAPVQDFALVVTGPVRLETGPRQPSGRIAP